MLRVIYSNQTEELLRALVERISADATGPFAEVRVVAPNAAVKAWIELGVARLAGFSWDVEELTAAGLLASVGAGPTPETVLLDRLLTVLLDDGRLNHPELSPVREYLGAAGDEATAIDRRRVQLARKLAGLFSQYELFRPDLLDCWRAGLLLGDSDFTAVEPWQRRIWLECGLLPTREPSLSVNGALHLFLFSTIPRSLIAALGRVARETAVFSIYTLNPCQEVWEATGRSVPLPESPRRYERRGSDLGPGEVFSVADPFRLSNPGEILPLQLWGKPGRENLRLLNALTACELTPRMREPQGTSLLHRLQKDIVARSPQRSSGASGALSAEDESIVFLECTTPRREIEVIAAEIHSLLKGSAPPRGMGRLRFEDIAVLLVPSQAARYRSLVSSVFRDAGGIPHHVTDLPLESEGPVVRAVLELLQIPLGPATASSLARCVIHPLVMAPFPGSNVEEWTRWIHEIASEDRGAVDWDGGLRRLALSAMVDDSVPHRSPQARRRAADFGLLLRSLLADAKEASRAVMTLPAWMDFIAAFLATYVEPRSESDRRTLRACLEAVSAVAEAELEGRKVRYGLAHELVRERIERLTVTRGSFGEGVHVSPLAPMRPIPHQVVFVAGLSEPDFPARDRRDGLDLRRAHRRAGDVTATDEDRYLFLETVLSARERLYLSWVGRDPLHPEPIPPSSVVAELLETLRSYGSDETIAVRRHPDARSDDPRTTAALPEAARESRAARLGEQLRGHLGVARLPPLAEVDRVVPDVVARALRWRRVASDTPPRTPSAPAPVRLDQLLEFLECPLQGSVRFHLRLQDNGASPVATADVLELCRGALAEITNGSEPRPAAPGERSSLHMNVSDRRIEITRSFGARVEAPHGLVHLCRAHPERFHPQKESLKGFLDHVFSCAAGHSGAGPYTFFAVNVPLRGVARATAFRFAPLDPDAARSYLKELVSDLLAGIHEYVLPCEAVFGSIDPARLDRTSSVDGPVPYPEDYRRLDESERETLVRRRFDLYFRALLSAGESA